jgi:hypothetical protein
MTSLRTRLVAVAATTIALAIAAPVAGAGAQVPAPGYAGGVAPGECVGPYSPSGIGDAGATENQACGDVLVFVGPSVGQVAAVIPPTIIGSVINAPVTVSAGAVGVVTP